MFVLIELKIEVPYKHLINPTNLFKTGGTVPEKRSPDPARQPGQQPLAPVCQGQLRPVQGHPIHHPGGRENLPRPRIQLPQGRLYCLDTWAPLDPLLHNFVIKTSSH